VSQRTRCAAAGLGNDRPASSVELSALIDALAHLLDRRLTSYSMIVGSNALRLCLSFGF
jgi:hypothetical protein